VTEVAAKVVAVREVELEEEMAAERAGEKAEDS